MATPDGTRAEFVAGASERGLHVVVEKPIAPSEEECKSP